MAKDIEVKVPDIGDYTGVPVIDVLVKPGDTVEKETPLVTLESDKATLDVPSPEAGVVKSIKLKAGDKVSAGDAVLVLEVGGESAETKAAPAKDKEPAPAKEKPKAEKAAEAPTKAKADKKEDKPQPAEKPAAASKGGTLEVTIPDIGDYKDVPVIELMVKDGDAVEKDAPLLTLESDKSTLDVPAPQAGTVRGFKLKVGDKVSQGTAVCTLEIQGGGPEAAAEKAADAPAPKKGQDKGEESAKAAAPKPQTPPEAPPEPPPEEAAKPGDAIPYASPAIRKFARELGVDLGRVAGSGPKGRITREDVQGFVKKSLAAPAAAKAPAAGGGIPAIPAVDFSLFGPVEVKPLARIRKLSAAHLHRAWLNVPHVTQTDEADITGLEAFRKAQSEENEASGKGPKLTLLPFVLKGVAKAMELYPEFNASLSPDGESLVMKKYTHVGFAADTPNGLVVPVVRDVDKKGIAALATETSELAKKARDGKLKPDEMKGGCFSVSSLGGIGGSHFTPIVNVPEVAILGVSRAVMKPVWDGKAFQPRLMVPLSLSYDHRVIDGAYAARFIVALVKLLSDFPRLML
jgi:pyruvate dehydrogenase E2 component (dihydrolipoyllysine-residue acetyltransferase)